MQDKNLDPKLFGELAMILTIKHNWSLQRQKLRNYMNYTKRPRKKGKFSPMEKITAEVRFREFNDHGREEMKKHLNKRLLFLLRHLDCRLRHNSNSGYEGLITPSGRRYAMWELKTFAQEHVASLAIEKFALQGDQ